MSLSGSPLDFLFVFFGGVLLSFTPCIYPLLPITIAYIGASSANSKIKGFSLSLIYVTGISLTYSLLGLLAVLTGSVFGHFSSQPLVRIIAGLIIVFFGFALWGGRGFRLPLLRLPTQKKPAGYLSCFILGLTSGLLISPCVAPALGSILAFVAAKRNFVYGALLLFSFAYGMGVLLILAGTFSSILTALPKSGHWMEAMKKVCAVILIAIGIYFVVTGTVNLVYAQELEIESSMQEYDFTLSDLDGNKITLSEFKNKKSVVLYFWTTWCPFCLRELVKLNQIYPSLMADDIEVLAINVNESELKVRQFLKRNPTVLTVLLDSDVDVAKSYGVMGVPTFVIIDKRSQILFQGHYFPQNEYKRLLE